ncbi:MAG: hypothetical protein WDW38_002042 [Sanguina aurantia]
MGVFSDDSTGKGKIAEAKNRNRILASVFLLGLCLGVVISERAYISKVGDVGPGERGGCPTCMHRCGRCGSMTIRSVRVWGWVAGTGSGSGSSGNRWVCSTGGVTAGAAAMEAGMPFGGTAIAQGLMRRQDVRSPSHSASGTHQGLGGATHRPQLPAQATSVSTSFLKPVPSTAHTHSSTMLSCTFRTGPGSVPPGGSKCAHIAPGKEVLVAVANKNTQWDGMLDTFMKGIRSTKVDNHLILALDVETKVGGSIQKWCDDNKVNSYLLSMAVAKAQADTGENHAVSAMKFGILRRFVSLGYSVLLSDVDVCIFRNPFDNLYRDSDVEGMSDGFDERTAYGSIEGFDDPSMGWGRYAQYYKHFNMNSGFFYLRANERTLDLLTRLDDRLTKTKYWDQTAYNEEIFFLSHGAYKSPQVSVRIMELHRFMNSKFLFKDVRQRAPGARPEMPVIVHVNYHPDKHERMRGVIKFYLEGNEAALAAFPGGSEAGTR